ncbi:MAG: porin family protein [Bacteroidales bacterium]
MKLNSVLVFILLLFLQTVNGQNTRFETGIECGPGIITLRGNDFIKQYQDPAIGFSGGIFFQNNFHKTLSFRTNLAFERKGSVTDAILTDQEGNQLGNVRIHSNFDYLTMPFLLKASTGSNLHYYAQAGPYIGFLLKSSSVSKGDEIETHTSNETSLYKRFDTGFSTGIGLSIPIHENIRLSFEVRNNLGLYNISAKSVVNNGTIKTNSFNFLFGMAYGFDTIKR